MSKLNSPDGYVNEVRIRTQSGTKTVKAGKDGRYSTDNPAVVSALKQAGFTTSGFSTYVRQTGSMCHNEGSRITNSCIKCGRKRTLCTTYVDKEGKRVNPNILSEQSYEKCNNLIVPCECDTIAEA
jgi:hypothetical protein